MFAILVEVVKMHMQLSKIHVSNLNFQGSLIGNYWFWYLAFVSIKTFKIFIRSAFLYLKAKIDSARMGALA